MEIIRKRVSDSANIIFGTCYDESLSGKIQVSIIIGGIDTTDIAPAVAESTTSPVRKFKNIIITK